MSRTGSILNMNYKIIAAIDQDLCIKCGLCHIACEDTSHQSIAALAGRRTAAIRVIDEECVGCNLCQHVCPVPDCITMVEVDTGQALSELDAASAEPDAQGGGGVNTGRRGAEIEPLGTPHPNPPRKGGGDIVLWRRYEHEYPYR